MTLQRLVLDYRGKELVLAKRQEVLVRERRIASSADARIAVMQKQAALALMAGNKGQATRLRTAIARAKTEQRSPRASGDQVFRRSAIDAARSADSPGGKAITASEMEAIMDKNNGKMMRTMRAAAALVSSSPEFFRFFDAIASKDFEHRTSMKADAR